MKQKIKSAPKELVRRGLDDGTERLRGQLRDAAQRGQADDYGGDRIEDTAVSGARRTGREIESLLKQRKRGKTKVPDGDQLPPADPPAAQEPPADPSPQEPPRIKTREAAAARESGTVPSVGGKAELTPAAGSERQRIKIRESTVRDTHVDAPLTPQDGTQLPRIKTREPVAVREGGTAPSAGGRSEPTFAAGSERQRIKVRESTVRDTHTDAPLVPRDGTRPHRIKAREVVVARESGTTPSAGGRSEPTPAAGSKWQRIKIRESTVRNTHADTPLALQDETHPPRIKAREPVVYDPSVGGRPVVQTGPERPQIKTKETVTRDLCVNMEAEPQAVPKPPQIKTREMAVQEFRANAGVNSQAAPESPQIRTREVITQDIRPNVEVNSQSASVPPQIKTREITTQDLHVNADVNPQTAPEPPRIKTKGAVTGTPPDRTSVTLSSGERPSDRLQIKTKDVYIQRQSAAPSEQPSKAFVQGQNDFMQEQGRRAAVKRAEAPRTANGVVPQVKGGEDVLPSVPARRGYTSGGHGTAPVHSAHQPVSSNAQPARESGRSIIKATRLTKKAPERTAHHAIKTAERSSRRAIKTTQRTAKTTAQTVKTVQKTAQATTRAAQRAVQAARATAKAAATTAKATAKATVAAIKAAIAAIQALAAAIAAGGWVAVVIILILCLVGLLITSPFGVFFLDGGSSPGADSTSAVMAQINQEYADTLSSLQAGGSYDSVEIIGRPPSWVDVFSVFAVKTVTGDGVDVVVLDEDRVDRLRTVFWDMTRITTETRTVEHPATDDEDAWTETVLVITVTPRTPDDMRVFYAFTEEQNAALDMLLTTDSNTLWSSLLYGSSDEIVAVALSQVGNVGGQPYWSWYGFSSRVEWCACFVSWCANECGYIDAGIIPKFSSCSAGASWFKSRGQWQDNSYEPHPGDIIFFDWDYKGSSGPQNNSPDHVGIVERVENGVVYTVEGNSGNSCRQRHYNIGHYEIWGYATPTF